MSLLRQVKERDEGPMSKTIIKIRHNLTGE
jgi:hypothetical protein